MARAAGRSRPYVRRCLWLSTWPGDVRAAAQARPDIFTARVLVATLATSMARYEAKGWRLLRSEVARMSAQGVDSRPRKRRRRSAGRASSTQAQPHAGAEAQYSSLRQQMLAEAQIREALRVCPKTS